jgi:hypothetical protein
MVDSAATTTEIFYAYPVLTTDSDVDAWSEISLGTNWQTALDNDDQTVEITVGAFGFDLTTFLDYCWYSY